MKVRSAVDRAVAPLGLTHATYSLLASLYHVESSGLYPSQRELAERTGMEALYVSKLARSLELSGLIARTPDPVDTRAVQLSMTTAGRKVTEEAVLVVKDLMGELMAPIGGVASERARAFVACLTDLLDGPVPGLSPPLDKEQQP